MRRNYRNARTGSERWRSSRRTTNGGRNITSAVPKRSSRYSSSSPAASRSSTAAAPCTAARWSEPSPSRASFRAGSNMGGGQVRAADYFLQPDIVSTNKNSGGGGMGAALGGVLGHTHGWANTIGTIAGGININKGEANVTLSLVNAHTTEESPDRRLCPQDRHQLGCRRRCRLVGRLRSGWRLRLPEHGDRPDHRARLSRRVQKDGRAARRRRSHPHGRAAALSAGSKVPGVSIRMVVPI